MPSRPYTLTPLAIINAFLTIALLLAFGRDRLLRLEVKRLRHIEQTAQEIQRELEWNRQARWSSIRLRDEIRRLQEEKRVMADTNQQLHQRVRMLEEENRQSKRR